MQKGSVEEDRLIDSHPYLLPRAQILPGLSQQPFSFLLPLLFGGLGQQQSCKVVVYVDLVLLVVEVVVGSFGEFLPLEVRQEVEG